MSYTYNRTVRFKDTDAAGVVYFANVLAICHEAYEASLMASGINLKLFFSDPTVALPIVHASVDCFHPLFCGDALRIQLTPKQLNNHKFMVTYQVFSVAAEDQLLSQAQTQHMCIDAIARTRINLPNRIIEWLMQWSPEDVATP